MAEKTIHTVIWEYVLGNVGRATPVGVADVGKKQSTRRLSPAIFASEIALSGSVHLAIAVGVGKDCCFQSLACTKESYVYWLALSESTVVRINSDYPYSESSRSSKRSHDQS